VRLKPSGVAWLGDVPEHWEVMPLKQALLSMEYGISASATDDGTIRLLTMGHVKDGKVIIPKHGGVNRVDKRLLIAKGDLLFNRTNSAELVGKVGLVTDTPGCETTFASYLVRLKTKGGIDPVYLNYLLNSSSILGIARQMAIPSLHQSNLNPTRYGRVQIALPPYDEQKHIVVNLAAECKNLDLAITHAQTQIALMRDYRTHLIADVVTGKLDVRAAAAQLPLEPLAPGAVQNDLPDSLEGDEDLTDDPTTEASEGETSDE
jgi:type I restriction enzyme S subunit